MNWVTNLARRITPKEGGASLFGVVLYTDAHANIRKVLNDPCYWHAFNEASGPRWAVFAVTAAPGRWGRPDLPRGSLGFMIPVWKEPSANKELLADFELESTSRLPLLVVFALDASGNVRRSLLKLSDESVQDAYNSIKSALATVQQTLEKISPENLPVADRVFEGVSYQLKHHNDWQALRRGLEIWRRLAGLKP